ncbi:DNA polymerase interacting tetratricopeptide repeat-containing, protein of 47 kDa isoform X2 [Tribolium castaneum]|uniref:DNA polymerase interacting tetratricopeptide repeat-containing, protein of 47 kDa isoform X2 n=1 Tax=Tribolium castaneum TaxID=7070 RepID=UPI0030FE8F3D
MGGSEDITNHPFFMKTVPEDGAPLHPLYEGLQKLKYDPDENEPQDLAIAYKDDGNFNFKHKKYRMAVISYTEGIKAKCGNDEIEATLYNNRSAAHFFLGNHRSALADAEMALKLKPGYGKALVRAANCCYKTGKFDKAIEYCDQILGGNDNNNNEEAQKLREMSLNSKKIAERDARRREKTERKQQKEEALIIGEILKRGIDIEGRENLNLAKLEPQFPQLFNSRVAIRDGRLVWPVVLFYPEYKIMDYIQEFDECDCFSEQLSQVFETRPEWDCEGKYRVGNLNVYFEDKKNRIVPVDVSRTLLEVLKLEGHVIREGTPKFIILPANSRVEKLFLARSL